MATHSLTLAFMAKRLVGHVLVAKQGSRSVPPDAEPARVVERSQQTGHGVACTCLVFRSKYMKPGTMAT